ncbi:hypothetical protein QQ045_027423 [Rhodiola kirilowii]
MEDLIAQFTVLSNRALTDKSFDPSTIEHLMELFELESYKAWAAAELELTNEAERAEIELREAEEYLDSVMESAMDEFGRFEADFDRMAMVEMKSLKEKSAAKKSAARGKKKVQPSP